MIEMLEKLAPFMVRARVVVNGRQRLLLTRQKLAFLLITPDLSENSRKQIDRDFSCPVHCCLTSEEIHRLFGFENTKILGVYRSSLADSLARALAETAG